MRFYFQVKCAQYWPDEGDDMYGEMRVALLSTVVHSDYTIREMTITKVGSFAESFL